MSMPSLQTVARSAGDSKVLLGIAALWVACTVLADRSHEVGSTLELLDRIHCGVIEGALILVAFFVLARLSLRFLAENNEVSRAALVLPALFSLAQTFGANLETYEQLLNPTLTTAGNTIELVFCFVGWFMLLWLVCNVLLALLARPRPRRQRPSRFSTFANVVLGEGRSFPVSFLVLLLLWTPSFLILFPGVVTWDTYYQINMGLGYSALSDHQPYLVSIVMGSILRFGMLFTGSIYGAVAFVTVAQAIALAAIIALCISRMPGSGTKLALLLFYGLSPLVSWYSVSLWKDVLHGGLLLLAAVLLWELCQHPGGRGRKRLLVSLSAVFLLVMLTKKSGIYVLAIALAVCLLSQRTNRIATATSFSAALALFLCIQSAGFSLLGVQQGRASEALSIPLQQVARTVSNHPDEIDDDTKTLIGAVLPYDSIEELYYPKCSDNIKSNFDEEAFGVDKARFALAYLKLGAAYPLDYLEAFLCGTCGYWYPETKYWFVAGSDYLDMLNMYAANGWEIYDGDYADYRPLADSEGKKSYLGFVESLRNVPGVSALFSIGAWAWAFALIAYVSWRLGLRGLSPLLSVALGAWIVCMISPVYAEMRYAFALALILPVVLCLSLRACGTQGSPSPASSYSGRPEGTQVRADGAPALLATIRSTSLPCAVEGCQLLRTLLDSVAAPPDGSRSIRSGRGHHLDDSIDPRVNRVIERHEVDTSPQLRLGRNGVAHHAGKRGSLRLNKNDWQAFEQRRHKQRV